MELMDNQSKATARLCLISLSCSWTDAWGDLAYATEMYSCIYWGNMLLHNMDTCLQNPKWIGNACKAMLFTLTTPNAVLKRFIHVAALDMKVWLNKRQSKFSSWSGDEIMNHGRFFPVPTTTHTHTPPSLGHLVHWFVLLHFVLFPLLLSF